jgi:hypothetical protein
MGIHSNERFIEELERSYNYTCLRAYLFRDPSLLIPAPNPDYEKFYRLLIQDKLIGLCSILGRTYPDLWPRAIKERLREDRYRQIPLSDWCVHQAETAFTRYLI